MLGLHWGQQHTWQWIHTIFWNITPGQTYTLCPEIVLMTSHGWLKAACVHATAHHGIKNPQVWPFDFYAAEMDIGFKKCHDELNRQHPVEQVFSKHFDVKFVKSMFYDHCCHWFSVSLSVHNKYIDYGYTADGHWLAFLCKHIKGHWSMMRYICYLLYVHSVCWTLIYWICGRIIRQCRVWEMKYSWHEVNRIDMQLYGPITRTTPLLF